MKVFLSWSGEKSKKVALALRSSLKYFIQSIEPWMSEKDIEAGRRWSEEMHKQLATTRIGILCITSDNVTAPWIYYEAGALAYKMYNPIVIPYLFDLKIADVPNGPLALFQMKEANEYGTFDLINTINKAEPKKRLLEEHLKITFDDNWPKLKKELLEIYNTFSEQIDEKAQNDKIDEFIDTLQVLEGQKGELEQITVMGNQLKKVVSELKQCKLCGWYIPENIPIPKWPERMGRHLESECFKKFGAKGGSLYRTGDDDISYRY